MNQEISQPFMACVYYQANVDKKRAWFVMGVFRNEDNVAFVRALDGRSDKFEFFVPRGLVEEFLHAAKYLTTHGYIDGLEQMKNRLA